jgi:hypothetical protein
MILFWDTPVKANNNTWSLEDGEICVVGQDIDAKGIIE